MLIHFGNNAQNIDSLRVPPCSFMYAYKTNITRRTMPLYPRIQIVTDAGRVLIVDSVSTFRGLRTSIVNIIIMQYTFGYVCIRLQTVTNIRYNFNRKNRAIQKFRDINIVFTYPNVLEPHVFNCYQRFISLTSVLLSLLS